jgi:hypothetical protein
MKKIEKPSNFLKFRQHVELTKVSSDVLRKALDAALDREQRERNAEFAALSGPMKRVTIARDVLLQLEAKRLVPSFGNYLRIDEDDFIDALDDDGVREVLAENQCHACGIGSLFVAAVDRVNECTVGDMEGELNNSTFMVKYLSEWFERDQLIMIESAFEGHFISAHSNSNDSFEDVPPDFQKSVKRAISFTRRLNTAAGRLRKIMTNIVENRGTFIPVASR